MVTVGRFFISQASIVRLRGIEWASSGPLSGTHSACGFIARSEGTSPGEPGRKLRVQMSSSAPTSEIGYFGL